MAITALDFLLTSAKIAKKDNISENLNAIIFFRGGASRDTKTSDFRCKRYPPKISGYVCSYI